MVTVDKGGGTWHEEDEDLDNDGETATEDMTGYVAIGNGVQERGNGH